MRTCGARVDLKQMPEHVAAEPGRANGHQGGWPIANGLVCSRNWSRRGDVHRSWRSGGPSEPRGARAPSGFGCPRSGFESPRAASSRRDPGCRVGLPAPTFLGAARTRRELRRTRVPSAGDQPGRSRSSIRAAAQPMRTSLCIWIIGAFMASTSTVSPPANFSARPRP